MPGPYFIVDLAHQAIAHANFDAAASSPNLVGAIIKATQGTSYAYTPWFGEHWPKIRNAAGGRYGETWFRGAYHFLNFIPGSGAAQADYYLRVVEAAGGWGEGDIHPIVDVEGDTSLSNQQIIDLVTAFARRIKERRGGKVILYAGALLRDRGITSHMGCDMLWSPHMTMQKAGWDRLALWQYVGDGKYYGAGGAATGYPTGVSGLGGTVDMNVCMNADGDVATSIDQVRSLITSAGSGMSFALKLGASALVGAGLFFGFVKFMRGRKPRNLPLPEARVYRS